MITVLAIGGVALLLGGYFALDWWLAGFKSKRSMARARHGQVGNARVDEALIEREAKSNQTWGI